MHDHDHHNHGGGHHSHVPQNERKLALATILTAGFMVAEVIGGMISGSLALLADAGHMLTDSAALTVAWFALRLGRRPADWKMTYGFDRFSVMAAFVNGLALFGIAIWITIEAIHRLADPVQVLGGTMLWIALLGLCVNILAFWILTRGETHNLNVRAAALHVAGDLLGSVAALVASLVIIYTGWMPIDPMLSVLVSLLILKSAWSIVRESGAILLEGAPSGLDIREVTAGIKANVSGVSQVQHVHAWSVTQERPMITMEVLIAESAEAETVKRGVKAYLAGNYQIEHSTIEIFSHEHAEA